MKKIFFLITDAGGGHRAPASSLLKIIQHQHDTHQIFILNIYQDLMKNKALISKLGMVGESLYNRMLIRKHYWFCRPGYHLVKLGYWFFHRSALLAMKKFWMQEKPDLVVSFMPYANHLIGQSLKEDLNQVPFVTVLTDPYEWANKVWFNSKETYYICPTSNAYYQAKAHSLPEQSIQKTSGLIVNPEFYVKSKIDHLQVRKNLYLDPDLLTGLVMFGGYGCNTMKKLIRDLAHSTLSFQLIFVCGKNADLAAELRAFPTAFPKHIVEWTDQIPHYMDIADFFIGKPGAGSINEALIKQLPVITTSKSSKHTMLQEKPVADFVHMHDYGICVQSFDEIEKALGRLIQNFSFYQKQVNQYENQAIFEVSAFLNTLLVKEEV